MNRDHGRKGGSAYGLVDLGRGVLDVDHAAHMANSPKAGPGHVNFAFKGCVSTLGPLQ